METEYRTGVRVHPDRNAALRAGRVGAMSTEEQPVEPATDVTSLYREVDRAEWCLIDEARGRVVKGQLPLLDALERLVGA